MVLQILAVLAGVVAVTAIVFFAADLQSDHIAAMALGSRDVARTTTQGAPVAGGAVSSATAAVPDAIAAQMQKGLCVACHLMDVALVGPSWRDIAQRYEGQDVLNQLVRKAKDGGQGVWGVVPMPPNVVISESEIEPIVKWVLASGAVVDGEPSTRAEPATTKKATEADVSRGQDLFQGRGRFANRGAACNSCHDVQNDAVIGGGILAKDLTSVFSRLGGTAVRAILGTPPFPVMQQAYKDRPLTEDEVFSLVAFLEEADAQSQFQHPRDYGFKLFFSGLVGAVALFGVCGVTWRGRKKQSVYQEIFDRQAKSM